MVLHVDVQEDTNPQSYLRTDINGTLLNVLNPKLSMFFLAFLPQFVPEQSSESVLFMFYLAAVFMLMTFVVFVFYGLFAASARKLILGSPTIILWLRRLFASAFGLLSLRLAFSDR